MLFLKKASGRKGHDMQEVPLEENWQHRRRKALKKKEAWKLSDKEGSGREKRIWDRKTNTRKKREKLRKRAQRKANERVTSMMC